MFTLFLLLSQILTANPAGKAQRVGRVTCSALLHSLVVHLHMSGGLILASKLPAGLETGVALAAAVKDPPLSCSTVLQLPLSSFWRAARETRCRLSARDFCLSKVEADSTCPSQAYGKVRPLLVALLTSLCVVSSA